MSSSLLGLDVETDLGHRVVAPLMGIEFNNLNDGPTDVLVELHDIVAFMFGQDFIDLESPVGAGLHILEVATVGTVLLGQGMRHSLMDLVQDMVTVPVGVTALPAGHCLRRQVVRINRVGDRRTVTIITTVVMFGFLVDALMKTRNPLRGVDLTPDPDADEDGE